VDLSGGEWCIATTIHVPVAIQADVTGSEGMSGAWQQLADWSCWHYGSLGGTSTTS
jgi:hypothetical protein